MGIEYFSSVAKPRAAGTTAHAFLGRQMPDLQNRGARAILMAIARRHRGVPSCTSYSGRRPGLYTRTRQRPASTPAPDERTASDSAATQKTMFQGDGLAGGAVARCRGTHRDMAIEAAIAWKGLLSFGGRLTRCAFTSAPPSTDGVVPGPTCRAVLSHVFTNSERATK
jgi:hypothetical protein